MNKECATCKYLGICKLTDASKILSHFVCENYDPVASPEIVQARYDVIAKFGEAGLKVIAPTEGYREE
jgi:hypothetical protein